ncbi:endo-1,4-beta-xylanase [Pseudaminobacter soli (ex Li et al. 2025)]|nr:endo-1,4-beta-xylanase [Mesorhizobium soli]
MRMMTDRYFGTAARIEWINAKPALKEAILRDCSCLTPEIGMNWAAIEPKKGTFEFGSLDGLSAFALQHGLDMHGHTLIWDQTIPAWAKKALSSGEAGWETVASYLAVVVSRYPSVSQWNVVNEPIDTEGTDDGMRRSEIFRAFGADYVGMALETARRHAPHAKLFINEHSLEYANPVDAKRRTVLLRLAEGLLLEGKPLDAVGLQAHLDLGKGPLDIRAIRHMIREVAGMGLEVFITELDVRERDFSLPEAARDMAVADGVKRYLDVVLAEPSVKGIVTWGMSDEGSWLVPETADLVASGIASGSRVLNRGLPYDKNLQQKPMYRAIREAMSTART